MPGINDIASGINSMAVYGAAAATMVIGRKWLRLMRSGDEERIVYLFGVWTVAVAMLALYSAYWQGYYIARAAEWSAGEKWFLDHAMIANVLKALMGFAAAMKLRYVLARVVGQWWLIAIISGMGAVFALHTVVPMVV